MAASELNTYRALITAFTDFLTVAIHTILYERRVYPQTSFLTARKYNIPVRQNRHPKVCEWINDAIAAVRTELLKCTVDRIAVVIYSTQDLPSERFVFDASRFPVISAADMDTAMQRQGLEGEPTPVLPIVDMEEQFRAAMSKLASCGTTLRPRDEGGTFTVAVELKENGPAPVQHPQAWIPVQPESSPTNLPEHLRHTTHPVRAIAAGEMVFESWIEELNAPRSGQS